jgi:hypothetical protein
MDEIYGMFSYKLFKELRSNISSKNFLALKQLPSFGSWSVKSGDEK